jgi:protoporphyrinogen oxidase
MEKIPVVILGAGVAGLGAAYRAAELGRHAVVFEARPTAGGLLDNFCIDGFRFDHSVHLSFATEKLVREIFDKTPYYSHPSDSYCFETDRWLKHPVQNNLYPLHPNERMTLIKSFLGRPEILGGTDYESWLRHQYGDAISERYPIRYTKKYWDTLPSELSTTWIGNRMRRAEFEEILLGSLTDDTPNHYYTKEMRYPKIGGYKTFIQPLIDSAVIRYSHLCISIDTDLRQIHFDNGCVIQYEQLVSTLPLPELAAITKPMSESILSCAEKLKATSIDLISIGFKKKLIKDLWFYIYDEDIYASRAYSPSVKSPDNAPKGCSSLQFEVYSRGKESRFRPEDLKENTLEALRKMRISFEDEIIFMDHRRITYGNVIFDQGMEENRNRVLDWCSSVGISSCGRFGSWDYFWSNQSFISGYNSLDSV